MLEACGSLVEDNEVLEEVKNEVLLLLTDDEEYSPASSTLHTGIANQEQYTPTASTSTYVHQGEHDTPIASTSAARQIDTLADKSNNSASSAEASAGDSPDTIPQRPSSLTAGTFIT